MIRAGSEHDPRMTRDRLATVVPQTLTCQLRISCVRYLSTTHFILRLPRHLHMEVHKVLCLPRNLHMEVHKALRLPRHLRMEVHKVLHLPRNLHLEQLVYEWCTVYDEWCMMSGV